MIQQISRLQIALDELQRICQSYKPENCLLLFCGNTAAAWSARNQMELLDVSRVYLEVSTSKFHQVL